MRFRLAAELPCEALVGEAPYVVELVKCGPTGELWLRARALDEPVVFLLARFEDELAAASALADGFELMDGLFPRVVFESLVSARLAEACELPPADVDAATEVELIHVPVDAVEEPYLFAT